MCSTTSIAFFKPVLCKNNVFGASTPKKGETGPKPQMILNFKKFHRKYIGNQANEYYKSALTLPIYVDLKYKEQLRVIKLIRKFFKK